MTNFEEAEKHIGMPFQAVIDKLDSVASGQQKLEISFAKLEASIMPRHEILIEIEKRMPVTSYIADKDAIMERIQKLENAPQSTRAWMNTIIAASGCLSSLMVGVTSITVSLIAIFHVYHP